MREVTLLRQRLLLYLVNFRHDIEVGPDVTYIKRSHHVIVILTVNFDKLIIVVFGICNLKQIRNPEWRDV